MAGLFYNASEGLYFLNSQFTTLNISSNLLPIYLDKFNNRVAINNSNPGVSLDVSGGLHCTSNVNVDQNLLAQTIGLGSSNINNKIFVLYDNDSNADVQTATEFYGYGVNVNPGSLRTQVPTLGYFNWYSGNSNVMNLDFNGNLTISGNVISNTITNLNNQINTLSNEIINLNNEIITLNNEITTLSNYQPIQFTQRCSWLHALGQTISPGYLTIITDEFYSSHFQGCFLKDESSGIAYSNCRVQIEGLLNANYNGSTSYFNLVYASNFIPSDIATAQSNFTGSLGIDAMRFDNVIYNSRQICSSPWFAYPSNCLGFNTTSITLAFYYNNTSNYQFTIEGVTLQYR